MLHPVILCGGSGTRLWPMSRAYSPKQFAEFNQNEHSLFAQTFQRVQHLQRALERSLGAPIIICHEEYRFYVASIMQNMQIPGSRTPNIILEPEAKNTAPAIALVALAALDADEDAVLLVLPSDHALSPDRVLVDAVADAMTSAENGYLVTFGITPHSPKMGYGYIEQGNPLEQGDNLEDLLQNNVYHVNRFIEKPPLDDAIAMFEKGNFLWNSGMFMFNAKTYLEELEALSPDTVDTCRYAWQQRKQDRDFIRPDAAAFMACPAQSIDYAVMEHTKKAAVLPLNAKWNDMGSWESFYEQGECSKDAFGNVSSGDVLTLKTRNCYIHSQDRLVATLGLEDIIIVETPDAVLVANKHMSQEVRTIAMALKAQGRREALWHQKVCRPWGYYESLAHAERFQVKRIVVNPSAELSLQRHYHRAEHWVVVSGTAEITKSESNLNSENANENVFLLTENQSTYIAQGAIHKLKNPGIIPLVLIEIQSGSYLGEDDIVRFSDPYGRN